MTTNPAPLVDVAPASVEIARQRKEALREIVSIAPGLALGATGACYAVGLLIVNIYLNRYGIYTVDLVRSDFVVVGAAFVFLVAVAMTSAERGKTIIRKFPEARRQKKPRVRVWRVTLLSAQTLLALVVAPMFALSSLSRYTFNLLNWKIWLCALTLVSTSAHAGDLFRRAVWIFREALRTPDAASESSGLMTQAYFALDVVLSLSISIGSYALLAYPHLVPAFGGAHRDLVMLAPTKSGLELAQHLKLPINPMGDIGPLKLLTENASELVVVTSDDSSSKTRAVRMRREYIEAIAALAEDEPPTGGKVGNRPQPASTSAGTGG